MGGPSDVGLSLVAVESCGACGRALLARANTCPGCGLPVDGDLFPSLGPRALSRLVPGRRGAIALSLAVDALTVLAAAAVIGALGWLVLPGSVPWLIGWGAAGLLIAAALVHWAYRTHGRAIGGLVVGVRSVDTVQYLPAWPALPLRTRPDRTTMVNVRRGGDPIQPLAPGWTGLGTIGHSQATTAGQALDLRPRRSAPVGSVVIVFATGQVHWFTGSCVIGRSPVNPTGGDILSLPDISRRLSASHLSLAEVIDPGTGGVAVSVIDHHSMNGTWLERDGLHTPVPANWPVILRPTDWVLLGDFRFRVERGAS